MESLEGSGGSHSMDVRAVADPLAGGSLWMRVLGAVLVAQGALSVLTIVGILWAWMPIWAGVLLFQAAGAADRARDANDPHSLHEANTKLKKTFMLGGIFALIGVVFSIGYVVMLVGFGMSGQFVETLESFQQ